MQTDTASSPCSMQCAGACVDIQSDDANCGRCGHSCGGDGCTGGLCTPKLLLTTAGSIATFEVNSHGIFYSELSNAEPSWGASSKATLFRASLDGSSPTAIAADSSKERQPINIALDDEAAYWAVGSGQIYKIPHNSNSGDVMPNAHTTSFVTVGAGFLYYYNAQYVDDPLLKQPTGGGTTTQLGMGSGNLTIRVANSLDVYGIDFSMKGVIKKVPVNGKNAMSVAIPAMAPDRLALDGKNLYALSWMDRALMKVTLNGGVEVKLADAMASSLAVDATHVYLGGNDFVARVPIAGGALEPVASTGGLIGIADDYVYINTHDGHTILRIHK